MLVGDEEVNLAALSIIYVIDIILLDSGKGLDLHDCCRDQRAPVKVPADYVLDLHTPLSTFIGMHGVLKH